MAVMFIIIVVVMTTIFVVKTIIFNYSNARVY
jgi:hypothetical protein